MPASPALSAIGFDADDTLWQNEQFYRLTEERFAELLAEHAEPERSLAAAAGGREAQPGVLRLRHQGLHAVDDRDGDRGHRRARAGRRHPARSWRRAARCCAIPVETLPHVRETLEQLAGDYRIVLITKGDLFDQERKLAQSGLGELFDAVEIVSDKTAVDLSSASSRATATGRSAA